MAEGSAAAAALATAAATSTLGLRSAQRLAEAQARTAMFGCTASPRCKVQTSAEHSRGASVGGVLSLASGRTRVGRPGRRPASALSASREEAVRAAGGGNGLARASLYVRARPRVPRASTPRGDGSRTVRRDDAEADPRHGEAAYTTRDLLADWRASDACETHTQAQHYRQRQSVRRKFKGAYSDIEYLDALKQIRRQFLNTFVRPQDPRRVRYMRSTGGGAQAATEGGAEDDHGEAGAAASAGGGDTTPAAASAAAPLATRSSVSFTCSTRPALATPAASFSKSFSKRPSFKPMSSFVGGPRPTLEVAPEIVEQTGWTIDTTAEQDAPSREGDAYQRDELPLAAQQELSKQEARTRDSTPLTSSQEQQHFRRMSLEHADYDASVAVFMAKQAQLAQSVAETEQAVDSKHPKLRRSTNSGKWCPRF